MLITPTKTHKITSEDTNLFELLDKYVHDVQEKSILAITSKIVAITEGRSIPVQDSDKDELIEQESQFYLPRNTNPYNVSLTITRNTLVASAGIDESNADGNYILWPKDPQKTANEVRSHLSKRFELKNIGVIITDSKTTPMRWGVTAIAIAYSGFDPLKDYIGKQDLFGRKFEFEKLNIADCLASAASVVMGEGAEQTPMAIISDMPFVQFTQKNPTAKELKALKITMEEDIYGPFLKNVDWEKGKASS